MKGEETIKSEAKPQKRKAVESSEDSLSSDVDAQEKVEEEKTIESETEGKNDKEDMSTSQDVNPLELSPTPVADNEKEALENEQEMTKKVTEGGVISTKLELTFDTYRFWDDSMWR